MRRALALVLVCSPLVLVGGPAGATPPPACTDTFNGNAGSNLWSASGNWSAGRVPGLNGNNSTDIVCVSTATVVDIQSVVEAVRDTAALTVNPTGDLILDTIDNTVGPSTFASVSADGAFYQGAEISVQISGALTDSDTGAILAYGPLSAGSATLGGGITTAGNTLTIPTVEVTSGGDIEFSRGPANRITGSVTVDRGGSFGDFANPTSEVGSLTLEPGSTTTFSGDNVAAPAGGYLQSDGTASIAGALDIDSGASGLLITGSSVTGRFTYVSNGSVDYTSTTVITHDVPEPAGLTFAYADDSAPGVTLRGPDGTTARTVAGGYDPQLSPDGRWLSYQSGGTGTTQQPGSVQSLDVSASGSNPVTVVPTPGHLVSTDVDPGDGKVWLDQSAIKSVDVENGNDAVTVAGTSGYEAPLISPDGTRFAAQESGASGGIVVGTVDGHTVAAVPGVTTSASSCAEAPAWIDSTTLIYELRTPCRSTGAVTPMSIPIAGGMPTVLSTVPMTQTFGGGFQPNNDGDFAMAALTVAGHRGIWMLETSTSGAPHIPRLITEVDATSVSRPLGSVAVATSFPFSLKAGDPATPFTATFERADSGPFDISLSGPAVPSPAQVTLKVDTGNGLQPVTLTRQSDGSLDAPVDLFDELPRVDTFPMSIALAKGAPTGALTATFTMRSGFSGDSRGGAMSGRQAQPATAVASTTTAVAPADPNPPGAPGVTLTAGDGQVTYTVSPPADDGGSPITGYTVTLSGPGAPGPIHLTAAGTNTITGLANGAAYTISVTATNSAGPGPAGVAGPVTPRQRPATPVITGVSPSPRSLLIGFTEAPLPGAAPITGYTASCTQLVGTNSGSANGSLPSIKVTGLVDNTDYTCVVVAHSSVGDISSLPAPGRPGRLPTVKITIKAHGVRVTSAKKGTRLTITGTGTVGDRPASHRRILLTFRADKTKVRKTIATTTSSNKGVFTFMVTFAKSGAYQAQLPLGPALAFNKEVFVRRAV